MELDQRTTTIEEIKNILKDIAVVNNVIHYDKSNYVKINSLEIPLNPHLLAYCFDEILGFNVEYRISEKTNYIIKFDYKGTFVSVEHRKLNYCLFVQKQYRYEIIDCFEKVRKPLERLFLLIGEQCLKVNDFTMENESYHYFSKLNFYETRIEELAHRKEIIEKNSPGKFEIIECNGKDKLVVKKIADYLVRLENEITYDIQTYIDTFFSALEHVLTLLYPFTNKFTLDNPYHKDYIQNTSWHWETKIRDNCGELMPKKITNELRYINLNSAVKK